MHRPACSLGQHRGRQQCNLYANANAYIDSANANANADRDSANANPDADSNSW
jgi:hypothetical protein